MFSNTKTFSGFSVNGLGKARTFYQVQYTRPIATDAKGIHRADGEGPTVAWFADPAGNILSVVEGK